MRRYLIRRLAQAAPTILLVASLVFLLVHLVPGDPVAMMLGDGARASEVEELRHRLGLDRPVLEQYLSFMSGLARLDLGVSLHSGQPVTQVLAQHLRPTLELAVASLGLALLLAVPLGVASALHRGRWMDAATRGLALVAISVPSFWLGPMLILLVAIEWNLLPVSGRGGAASLILPALTLGAALAGLLTRIVRAAVAEELDRPHLLAARARGLSPSHVVLRHALKNALVPIVTVVGLQFGSLLTGAIITETIFAWPGLGRALIRAIHLRDFPVLQGTVLLIAATYVAVNLVTDLVYAWLDPRIRLGEAGR